MLRNSVESRIQLVPLRYQRTVRQFLKFGMTGTLGAVVDFTTFNILTRGMGWNKIYYVFNYEVIAANLVSVALAICAMFLINKNWTFRNRSAAYVQQGLGYFALNGTTFILNQILTSFFAFRVPLIASVFGTQADNAAKALAIGLILFLNFAGSKFLIFRKRREMVA